MTEFRGTWLTTSVRALGKRGLMDRYTSFLAPADRDLILYCDAVSWIPADLVVRHYEACDRLQLSVGELLAIGSEVTERVHGPSLALGRSIATASGVTPWTILGRVDKLWRRVMQGGGVAVAKVGPKEARVELLGFPVAHIHYNRIATRGIIRALVGVLCSRVWVHEVQSLCTRTTLGYRAQWV